MIFRKIRGEKRQFSFLPSYPWLLLARKVWSLPGYLARFQPIQESCKYDDSKDAFPSSRKHPLLEIASQRTLTNRSPSMAALSSLKSRKEEKYRYIYMYGSIDRQNGEIRIRESVEKEISISSCRNGYAAVNRLVAPSPHKYSIKFIRTNISSSRPTREKSYHDLRPRFIPGDWFRLQPSPISPSPNPRFPIVQTRYVSIYESTPYTHPIQIPLEESKIATSWSPTDTASGRANINSSIEFTSNRYLVFLVSSPWIELY